MIDIRPLFWVGSSKRDLKEFPDDAQQNVGFALHQAQLGDEHTSVKALKGFGGRGGPGSRREARWRHVPRGPDAEGRYGTDPQPTARCGGR